MEETLVNIDDGWAVTLIVVIVVVLCYETIWDWAERVRRKMRRKK